MNKTECQYCDGEGQIETDNNGPIVDCPICRPDKMPLYDHDAFERMVNAGTKAWADVPNASEWVDELRGNSDDT